MSQPEIKLQAGLAAVALGGNLPSGLGTPADALHEAVRRLAELGRVVAVSSFRVTAPVGYGDQPDFTNAACLLETPLPPLPLLHALLAIESSMGRDRSRDVPRNGPRVIDLDLLLYFERSARSGEWEPLSMHLPALTLPHPRMWQRAFVMDPLREILSDLPGAPLPPAEA